MGLVIISLYTALSCNPSSSLSTLKLMYKWEHFKKSSTKTLQRQVLNQFSNHSQQERV